jgi:hypothetical protein
MCKYSEWLVETRSKGSGSFQPMDVKLNCDNTSSDSNKTTTTTTTTTTTLRNISSENEEDIRVG